MSNSEEHLERLYKIGEEWAARRRMDQLAKTAAEILAIRPTDLAALSWRWTVCCEQNDVRGMLDAAEQMLQSDADSELAHRLMSESFVASEDYDSALHHATNATALAPHNPFNHIQLARVHWRTGNLPAYDLATMGALNLAPDLPDALALSAWSALVKGESERVESIALTLLRIAPDDDFVLSEVGKLFFEIGRRATGFGFLKSLLQKNPGDYRVHLSLANAYLSKDNWPAARTYLRSALELKPDLEDVRRLLRMSNRTPDDQMPRGWRRFRYIRTYDEDGRTVYTDEQDGWLDAE